MLLSKGTCKRMKKYISALLIACMVIISGFTTANAASIYPICDSSSTINYTEQSRFSVLIPETIDMNVGNYTFTAYEMNLTPDENVLVSIYGLDDNGYLQLNHINGKDVAQKQIGYDYCDMDMQTIEELPPNCVAFFKEEETTSEMSFYLMSNMNDKFKAGDYTGTAEFAVELLKHT